MKKQQRMALPRIKAKYARFRMRAAYSRIHRFGVYAMEEIPANQTVIEYTGKIRTWGEALKIPRWKHIYLASLNLRRGLMVDPTVRGSGAEFMNHSCAPNLKAKRVKGHLFLVSRRRIRAGEELTWHYHYPAKLRRVPCRCGARNCRRTFRVILTR